MKELDLSTTTINLESHLTKRYFNEISKSNPISSEEEIFLSKKIKSGDKKAAEKLIKANLRFVVSVAKKYQSLGLSLPDLINEGNIGLIVAAKKFDGAAGVRFITYAVWWIRQYIHTALERDGRTVRVPGDYTKACIKVRKQTEILTQQLNRPPNSAELKEALDIPERFGKGVYDQDRHTLYLDAILPDSEGKRSNYSRFSSKDFIPDEKILSEDTKKVALRLLSVLNKKEQYIIKKTFWN